MLFGIVFAVAVTFIAYLPFYRTPMYQDQSLHYYIGQAWLKGKIPYRDYGLGPGPHMALLYAVFSLFARNRDLVVTVLSISYVALGNAFLFLATDLAFGHAAAYAASVFFAFYIFSPRLIGDRLTPEVYMTTPSLMSLYFLFLSFQSPHPAFPFLCGLCLGAATLLRQGALFYLPPIGLVVLIYTPFLSWVYFSIGFMVLHLFWMAYFHKQKAFFQYLESTIWHPINLVLHAHPEGQGKIIKDEMRRSGREAFEMIRANSLTIWPLYLLALAWLIFSLFHENNPYTISAGALLLASLALIFPRRNFDCCYWLNSVPFAALLGGVSFSYVYRSLPGGGFLTWLLIIVLAGYALYVMAFDHFLYTVTDPEKRDRLYDPQKTGHASWWPTFNEIGDYLKHETDPDDRILVLGHAARIFNRSDRLSYFYLPSFVPFKSFDTKEYAQLFASLKQDYPDVIVLAGHMPAYPFNPQPYMDDLVKISEVSGIIYVEKKVIDHFPIYAADREKSYVRALLRNDFKNERLKSERDKVSAQIRQFEDDRLSGDHKGALIRYLKALGDAEQYNDVIYIVLEVIEFKTFASEPAFLHDLLVILGEAQYGKGDIADAEKTFKGILGAFPGSAPAYNNLGAMCFAGGKYEEARAMFQKALVIDPKNTDALANLAAL